MMLRIRLTDADIARVRIKSGPAPLTETMLSLEACRNREDRVALSRWRTATRAISRPAWQPLTELVQGEHLWPEFLAPRTASPQFADAVDHLRATALTRVRQGMQRVARLRSLPKFSTQLARGEPESLSRIADIAEAYFNAAIGPYWPRIRAYAEADVAVRTRIAATGGVQSLLDTLHLTVIWRPPVLHVPSYKDADISLHGQGLTLVPSFFNRTSAIAVPDHETCLIVYPIRFEAGSVAAIWQPSHTEDRLSALLGMTRAKALQAVATACSTAELARRIGSSASSASEHLSVLREAGLVATCRHRNTAIHTITELGLQLLRQARPSG